MNVRNVCTRVIGTAFLALMVLWVAPLRADTPIASAPTSVVAKSCDAARVRRSEHLLDDIEDASDDLRMSVLEEQLDSMSAIAFDAQEVCDHDLRLLLINYRSALAAWYRESAQPRACALAGVDCPQRKAGDSDAHVRTVSRTAWADRYLQAEELLTSMSNNPAKLERDLQRSDLVHAMMHVDALAGAAKPAYATMARLEGETRLAAWPTALAVERELWGHSAKPPMLLAKRLQLLGLYEMRLLTSWEGTSVAASALIGTPFVKYIESIPPGVGEALPQFLWPFWMVQQRRGDWGVSRYGSVRDVGRILQLDGNNVRAVIEQGRAARLWVEALKPQEDNGSDYSDRLKAATLAMSSSCHMVERPLDRLKVVSELTLATPLIDGMRANNEASTDGKVGKHASRSFAEVGLCLLNGATLTPKVTTCTPPLLTSEECLPARPIAAVRRKRLSAQAASAYRRLISTVIENHTALPPSGAAHLLGEEPVKATHCELKRLLNGEIWRLIHPTMQTHLDMVEMVGIHHLEIADGRLAWLLREAFSKVANERDSACGLSAEASCSAEALMAALQSASNPAKRSSRRVKFERFCGAAEFGSAIYGLAKRKRLFVRARPNFGPNSEQQLERWGTIFNVDAKACTNERERLVGESK